MTATQDLLFDAIATPWAVGGEVSRNRRGSLVRVGQVRAMTRTGAIVVRLDPAHVRLCVAQGRETAVRGR